MPQPQLPIAGDVLGAYEVLSPLGAGGMGVVYLAEHQKLKRKVALKLLHPEHASDPMWIRRFFAEARAVNGVGERRRGTA